MRRRSDDTMAVPVRAARTGTLTYGLRVGEVLRVSTLGKARLLAGSAGLDRVIERLNVMEVPDILPWVKPHELLLTTGYPLRHDPAGLVDLVTDLDARGLAAIAIKVGPYLDEIPAQMLAHADALGFPVIQLPDDVGFDDILNQVLTDVLNRQAALLARSEEIHRAFLEIVLRGGGLAELTDELVGLLGGCVVIADPAGRVLARSGALEALTAALGPDGVDGSGRVLVRTRARGLCTGPDGATYAVVPVAAGELDHGRIVAVPGERGVSGEDVLALEHAATVAALVVTRELAVTAVESKYQADFLRDLLTGRRRAAPDVVGQAASLGWDLGRPLVVLVAELDPGRPVGSTEGNRSGDRRRLQERFVTEWTTAVRAVDAAAAVAGFGSEVVAVLGAPAPDRLLPLASELAAALRGPQRTFATGVSRCVPDVPGLPRAYDQAQQAVRVGRRLQGRSAVAHFDGLGIFRLLSLVEDVGELQAYVAETLGDLVRDDVPELVDLRRTLAVLLETNLNVAETARRLHFHYNTLRYRVVKLERMVGPFTVDSSLRLNLAVALRVLEMRGLDIR
ncbi:MAG TPA: PucR family transcriptional regulator ligand-binding domain-containing protein [Mycobacteriales bacterium]|nr:PucR family transcriptional regulator ligand-binding domain-containing protein [Mycobacteriales bacterium]